jgi:hypothetical protein
LGKKTKLKAKGKRLYKNTHGDSYRVKPNYKLTKRKQHKKILRKLQEIIE